MATGVRIRGNDVATNVDGHLQQLVKTLKNLGVTVTEDARLEDKVRTQVGQATRVLAKGNNL